MTLKMKLISMISAFMLVLGLMLIGIYAVNQISVDFGGNISFTATDVYARVTGEVANAGVGSQTLPTLNFNANMTDKEVETEQARWSGLNLAFDEDATPITIEVTVENLSTSHTLRVNLTDNTEANENLEIAYQQDGEEYINGDDITLPKSTGDGSSTTTYLITFSIPNPNFSLPRTDFSIDINLFDESYVPPALEVTNVQINDTTPTTTSEYNGVIGVSEVLDLSNIQFETGETEVVISMTPLNANYIKNNVSWVNNDNVTITSTSLYLPKNTTGDITGGESKDLKITVTNNSGSPTTVPGLEVAFEEKEDLLQSTAEGETSQYTREGYWYVEMGTYSTTTDNEEGKRESEYLRWRYFSDTTSHYEFGRNTRPTGEGYFILETWIQQFDANGDATDLGVSWNNDYKNSFPYKHQLNGWTNIDANDYSTSTIRQYINGNTVQKSAAIQSDKYAPSGASTNMFECFNIDPDNDIIYTDIIGRTLGDLYTDMTDSSINPQDVDFPKGSPDDWTGATIKYSREDTDKFWLLSYYEAYTLLRGDGEWGDCYWLRSPRSSNSNNAWYVGTPGNLSHDHVYYNNLAVRAAFKFAV